MRRNCLRRVFVTSSGMANCNPARNPPDVRYNRHNRAQCFEWWLRLRNRSFLEVCAGFGEICREIRHRALVELPRCPKVWTELQVVGDGVNQDPNGRLGGENTPHP